MEKTSFFKKISIKILEFILKIIKNKDIKYFFNLAILVIIYGLILNYTVHYLFNLPWGIRYIIAWGLAFYILKEELPRIISKSFNKLNR